MMLFVKVAGGVEHTSNLDAIEKCLENINNGEALKIFALILKDKSYLICKKTKQVKLCGTLEQVLYKVSGLNSEKEERRLTAKQAKERRQSKDSYDFPVLIGIERTNERLAISKQWAIHNKKT